LRDKGLRKGKRGTLPAVPKFGRDHTTIKQMKTKAGSISGKTGDSALH